MDYKEANQGVYDRHANDFENDTKDYLREHILQDAELFLAGLPGKDILDLGSGPGRDSAFFKEKGFNPLCFDLSPEMIKLCQDKGLSAKVGDLESMPFQNNSFDGVWAYTSLLHMPKEKLSYVLRKINEILRQKGRFYLGMREGDFEGWRDGGRYPGERRFMALYNDKELRKALSGHFGIIHHSRIELKNAAYLNYLCKKLEEESESPFQKH